MKKVKLVGATGAVGQEILSLLEQRNFPLTHIRCFASPRSQGKFLFFRQEKIPLEILNENAFETDDLVFFCAGSSISKEWVPKALQAGAYVVDASSAFRKDPSIPLVIPEINGDLLNHAPSLVASPNCAATILLLPLYPLHRLFTVKRVVTSTYQAASGAGFSLMQELQEETRALLDNRPYTGSLPFPYAFNLYPHNSALCESGYVEEENKIREETRKILNDETIQLSATCVRVPVLRAHCVSANVEFRNPFTLQAVYAVLQEMPGLKLFENREQNRFPTPVDATGKDEIFCGRIRIDPSQPNTLEFWAVGDQLRKGAALNAVQIAEEILSKRSRSVKTQDLLTHRML